MIAEHNSRHENDLLSEFLCASNFAVRIYWEKMFKFGLGMVLTLLPIVGATVNMCIYPGTEIIHLVNILKSLDSIADLLENDTYYIESFPLNISHPAINLDGSLSNVHISNVNDNIYEPFDLSKLVAHREIQIWSLTFNNLTLDGYYNLTGDIGKLFYIFGTGPFQYSFYNFNINVTGIMSSGANGTCIKTSVDLTLDGVKGHFYNLMNDEELETIINDAMEAILIDVIEMVWEDEKEWNNKIWEEAINKIINGDDNFDAIWGVLRNTVIISN